MSDRKPIVLAPDPKNPSDTVLQQVQAGDQVDPATLPYDRLDKTRRLVQLLVAYLVDQGFDDMPEELLEELE